MTSPAPAEKREAPKGHLSTTVKRSQATPKEWLPLGAQIGDLVNDWSKRTDIAPFVGLGAGEGAPACFKPMIAEVEVNLDVAFGEGMQPEYIDDVRVRDVQYDHPVAMGAILHEAMHARHTLFDLNAMFAVKDRRVRTVIEMFEESRIETRGVEEYPENRSFLRASALKLVVAEQDMTELSKDPGFGLAVTLLLTTARVDAGVLEPADVEPIEVLARKVLGDELYDKLRSVWRRAQAWTADTDMSGLQTLAEEYVKLLEDAGMAPPESGTVISIQIGPDGKPIPGSGSGPGRELTEEEQKALQEALDEIAKGLGALADETEIEAREEGADQQAQEHRDQRVAEGAVAEAERKDAKREATKVFGADTGPARHDRTGSRLVERRAPNPAERAAAVQVGRALERARYRDREVRDLSSIVPPGRLRSRQMVQAAADRTRGAIPTAEPFKQRRRTHVEDPRLTVGLAVDISGSMSAAMQPMASAAWILSEAVRRVQGTFGAVYFGDSVFPVVKPGQHLVDVTVYNAPDGTEEFDKAFRALNGAMNLLDGSGARLLIVVSDHVWRPDIKPKAKEWYRRCTQAGVGVLILPYGHYTQPMGAYEKVGAVVTKNPGKGGIAQAAQIIGQHAAEALTRVGTASRA